MSGGSSPRMRALVETCTIASTIAAVANHAFAAIVDVKTDVMMSVYVELTLAISGPGLGARARLQPARPAARDSGDSVPLALGRGFCAREAPPRKAGRPEEHGLARPHRCGCL